MGVSTAYEAKKRNQQRIGIRALEKTPFLKHEGFRI
jgi:hypothetical protein